MAFRQVTIIGTGLIGGSIGLALKKRHLAGRIIGCDRAPVLERAIECGAIESGSAHPADAVRGSDLVLLATPVIPILDLIERLGPALPPKTLVTDVGSTKAEVVERAAKSFGRNAGQRFLAGHPMAGKEHAGVEFADSDLFEGAAWLFTPLPRQNVHAGLCGEFVHCAEKMGAKVAVVDAVDHDRFCAWISHLPQMISTALAAALVDEFGPDAPVLDIGGRALREMTRISGSPYSMWRDIAITNKKNLSDALHKLEQRLAHIRENLDSKQLADEFERAHQLRKKPPRER
ncbi:MAG TPA: prephenate dehydrogenase/arogenate dehydrogenase family protein [Terriglobales bacterium]|jgi:prephenate dehydrogenase|nr:prephenate dehydrogenase/arogenate dehydrogenase family protein [Terriglobales bacterium]